MEKKHTCKLCSRRFSNGRALGGHMRSHVTAATSKKTIQHHDDADVDTDPVTPSTPSGLGYGLRENPRKSIRLSDLEFSASAADYFGSSSASIAIVHDLESETESSSLAASHRRRSKRARRSPPEPESASVGSDTTATAEDDVAISLMLLSRDIGTEIEENGSSKYECGSCKKVFGSYQALGGHRASQKKTTNGCLKKKGAIFDDDDDNGVHECPVCYRVFGSGQALGGHKRSHSIHTNNSNNSTVVIRAPTTLLKLIDLNLPAPLEEDAEVSAVSDAEFLP